MAAESVSASVNRPKRPFSAAQAAGMPGTVTGYQPREGISPYFSRRKAASASAGAGPEELRPYICPPCQTMAKASPPRPLLVGSMTVRQAAAASTASTALPPRRRASSPAWAASGWEAHTIPFPAKTTRRLEG